MEKNEYTKMIDNLLDKLDALDFPNASEKLARDVLSDTLICMKQSFQKKFRLEISLQTLNMLNRDLIKADIGELKVETVIIDNKDYLVLALAVFHASMGSEIFKKIDADAYQDLRLIKFAHNTR